MNERDVVGAGEVVDRIVEALALDAICALCAQQFNRWIAARQRSACARKIGVGADFRLDPHKIVVVRT